METNSIEDAIPQKIVTDLKNINEANTFWSKNENSYIEKCSLNEVKNFNKMILETDDMETRSWVVKDDFPF